MHIAHITFNIVVNFKELQKHQLPQRYLMASQTTENLGRPTGELVDKWLALAREEYLPGNRFKIARRRVKLWKMNDDDAKIKTSTCHNIINMV